MNWYNKLLIKESGAPALSTRIFLKKLRNLGFVLDPVRSNQPGSHLHFVNPIIPHPLDKTIDVPFHRSGGTIDSNLSRTIITKLLGMKIDDFLNGRVNSLWQSLPGTPGTKSDIAIEEEPEEIKIPEWQKQDWYIKQQELQSA